MHRSTRAGLLGPEGSARVPELLRLHKQHVDPGYARARQTWTWLVDVMGSPMVLWGLAGVIMWWGIKSTRGAGLVAVASGLGAMLVLGGSLWRALGVGWRGPR